MKRKGKEKPIAFRDPKSGEQSSLENKQQELTASFSVNVHLLEPGVWLRQDRQEASGIQLFK